ncbi:MAG TPA: hypothetical protein VFP79_04055, partial [Pseudolabrys sp.]|nr:hypothetical protein [Pseudolabrys sp.]
LVRHGLTIREIPIHFRDRSAGVSISKREILRAMITLIWLTLDRRAAIPRPPAKSHDHADAVRMSIP